MDETPRVSFRPGMRPWHWLVVLLPAAEIGLATIVCEPLGKIFFPGDRDGGLDVLAFNLFLAAALSLGIGIWLTNPATHWALRIAEGLMYGVGLGFFNVGIAFAGCSMLPGF